MSGATAFVIAAAALLAIVLFILLRPLLRRRPAAAGGVDQREANLAILRGELRELERSRDEGSLSTDDFVQARQELQRRLLEEVGTANEASATMNSSPRRRPGSSSLHFLDSGVRRNDDSANMTGASGKRTALFLLFALPLAAAGGYALLGTPQALDPAATQARVSPGEIDAMLQKLVDRLKANPDDPQGWLMLARSYKVLGCYAESAEAFGRVGPTLEQEPALLADYAEVLVQHSGTFTGKPNELIARALALAPNEPQVLFIAGAAANEREDFAAVADYWGRLLLQLEPGSEDARAVEQAVTEARAKAAKR